MKKISDYFGTKTAIKCENEQEFIEICNLLGILSIPDFDYLYNCIVIREKGLARIRESNTTYTILPYSDFFCGVPELVGVEMEVSDFGTEWFKSYVVGKINGKYLTEKLNLYNMCRPITKKVLTATLQELAEMLNVDEIQLK